MKWIISNHKNMLEKEEIEDYKKSIQKLDLEKVKLIICPNSSNLPYFKNLNIELGSQNVSLKEDDITIQELKELDVHYTIVGHADRIYFLNETEEEINKKIIKLLSENINPIICIGEKNYQQTNKNEIIIEQLNSYLKNIYNVNNIIIAYEPVWAINTGLIPDKESLKETINIIKNQIYDKYQVIVPVLYGGSINKQTIKELKDIKDLDGYLIGKSSLNIEEFKNIIEVI